MLVSKNAKFALPATHKNLRKSVEYRLRWVPNANFLQWPCTIHSSVCRFHFRWGPFFQWNMGLRLMFQFNPLVQIETVHGQPCYV